MRYFFHRLNGGVEKDEDGTECADRSEARHQAIVYAGQSIRDEPELVWGGGEMRIEVTDPDGHLVTTVVILAIDAIDPKHAIPQKQ